MKKLVKSYIFGQFWVKLSSTLRGQWDTAMLEKGDPKGSKGTKNRVNYAEVPYHLVKYGSAPPPSVRHCRHLCICVQHE